MILIRVYFWRILFHRWVNMILKRKRHFTFQNFFCNPKENPKKCQSERKMLISKGERCQCRTSRSCGMIDENNAISNSQKKYSCCSGYSNLWRKKSEKEERGCSHVTSAKIRGSWTPSPPISFRQHLPYMTLLYFNFLRRLVYMIKWRIFIC